MSQICRTCLEEISDNDFLSLNDESSKIKHELLACVPELDLGLIPDATMCVYCANSLHAAYDFKQKCLQSEEKIRSHKVSTQHLDLVQIKQEPGFDEKFDVVPGAGIEMEVIFIRDDAEIQYGGNFENGQFGAEPVNSFLDCDDEWTPKMALGGGQQNHSLKSNGKAHSINKKKLKSIKKEPKSSCYKSNNTGTRSKRLGHSFNDEDAFKCDLCSYSTPQETLLKLHVKTHAADKLHCPKCAYQTSHRQRLQTHMRSCNLDTKRSLKEKKSFKCTQCAFQALQKGALREHMQAHSTKSFKCTKCSYEVASLSTFKRHTSTHKAENCNQRDYQGYDPLALSNPTHKPGKAYKCNLCSYSTQQSSALANHVLTHTGERRFGCTLCGYKAIQKGNLKNHMKHHTSKGPFKCTKCSYSAAVNGNLQSHMRKCHE